MILMLDYAYDGYWDYVEGFIPYTYMRNIQIPCPVQHTNLNVGWLYDILEEIT